MTEKKKITSYLTQKVQIHLKWDDPSINEQQELIVTPPATLGRAMHNHIVLDNENVSNQHARLEQVDDTIMLIDHNSAAGTTVNGKSISRVQLTDDDIVQIGPFALSISILMPTQRTTYSPQIILTYFDPETNQSQEIIAKLPVSFGRHTGNTITLNGEEISRWHAVIEVEGKQVTLVDQNSKNGILLNGQRCQREPLWEGDQFQIGRYIFTANLDELTTVVEPGLGEDETRTFVDKMGQITLRTQSMQSSNNQFPPPLFEQKQVPIRELIKGDLPIKHTTYLTIGGGLGSFAWVDHLRVYGVAPDQIVAIGSTANGKPYGNYQKLCRDSQIQDHDRLRSNSDSCPDNLWGWPGYAVREFWVALKERDYNCASRAIWQIFGESVLTEPYTPRAGDVYDSLDREAERINWDKIWQYGRVRAIRKTDDGRYVIAYSQSTEQTEHQHKLIVTQYVHLAIGYPSLQFLDDLHDYRKRTGDAKRLVNAYEPHEPLYKHLRQHGGTVIVRGRGIVASWIIQRLGKICRDNPGVKISILHLLRGPRSEGNCFEGVQRPVENHWEFQPFNWPKACWGGDLKKRLEQSDNVERKELLECWGGSTTAYRADWQKIIRSGLNGGWYQIRFGEVKMPIETQDDKLMLTICGKDPIQDQTQLLADFIIDATGLIAKIKRHPLLNDLVEHYDLELNSEQRLKVTENFEISQMRNQGTQHGEDGRMYASGIATLGGPYAPVDSFLGLQYTAQRSADHLTSLNAPGLRYLNGYRSIAQWLRWAKGVQP